MKPVQHRLTIALALLGLIGTSPAWAVTSATRTSAFAYDAASGLLTQEVIEPNTPALRLQTDYVYDAFGNKTSATVSGVDIATRSTTTTYDAKGQFGVSSANALGQSETWQYDARFGVPTSHTGPNGLTTAWSYDGFGRKTLETRADGTQTKYAYLYCSGVSGGTASCPTGGAYLAQATPLAADGTTQNGPQSTSYYDQLGRVIAGDTQGFDASLTRVSTQYDSFGRVQQTSRPYFVTGGTPKWTVPTYDALGRVIKTTFPDASTAQTAYHGLSITTTNALNQTRTTVKNDQGLVASVTDALGKVTSYVYDPFGNIIKTTDPAGNVTTYSYDTRGRKVAMSDPDMGASSYAYDTAGELTSQTDAKSQTATFQYDKLGRLTQRVETDMTCVWAYDTAAMGIGKLASASITTGPSAGYQRSYTYDSLGRPSQVAITVDGTVYTIGTTYDANGRVSTATYPSGFAVQYIYTSLGYQSQLADAVTGRVYWTAKARDAELRLTQQQAGNGVLTNQAFDPNTGRLTSIQAGFTGTEVENFSYVYDTLGNLTSRSDANVSHAESFVYDGLNRLTSSTITAGATKTFAYDALGNITSKSDVGTYTYPAPGLPQPHAVTSISGAVSATFTYDANGNQTAGLGRSIGYASFNKPTSITQGTTNVSFTHDTEHQRLKKLDTNGGTLTTTLYLGAGVVYAEKVTGSGGSITWDEYLMVDGMVGVRFNNVTGGTVSTRYFHKDHLGSIAVLTDENAAVVQRVSYDPWGKQRNAATWADDPTGILPTQDQTTRGFTGQEQLADVGLVHMNGRVYDPQLGRFMSADPIVQDPYNAQSLNRYSYVYDNPLSITDPNGYCFLGLCHLTSVFKTLARPVVGPFGYIPSIGHSFDNWVRANQWFQMGLSIGATQCPGYWAAACSFGVAAYVAGINGGSFNQMLQAGVINGAQSAAMEGLQSYYSEPLPYNASPGETAAMDTASLPSTPVSVWTPTRVLASSLVGGITSIAQGGSFETGFAISFATSALTYGNYEMRQSVITNSMLNPDGSNINGKSSGFFGDFFKLGGARRVVDLLTGGYLPCDSDAGGCQGAPRIEGDVAARLGPISYQPGSFLDHLVESFSGPHDFLRNLTGSYDALGNGINFQGTAAVIDNVRDYVLIPPAAPFAAAALIPTTSYGAFNNAMEGRRH